MFRREWLYFYAFDVLAIDGEDLTGLPLIERKARLRAIMPTVESRLLYLDGLKECGTDLYRVACERDIEGCGRRGRAGPRRGLMLTREAANASYRLADAILNADGGLIRSLQAEDLELLLS